MLRDPSRSDLQAHTRHAEPADRAPAPEIDELVTLVYEAVRDPGLWEKFLLRLVGAFPGSAACLSVRMTPDDVNPVVHDVGYPARAIEAWAEGIDSDCPWPAEMYRRDVDDACAFSEICPPSRLRTTAFYRNWCAPHGFGDGFFVKIYHDSIFEGRRYGMLVIDCSPELAEKYQPKAVGFLRLLSPHIRRSLELHRSLRDWRRSAMADALGQTSDPALIVDGMGEILLENDGARAALRAGSLIARRGDRRLALPGFVCPSRIKETLQLARQPEGRQGGQRVLLPSKATLPGALSVLEIVALRINAAPFDNTIPFASRPDRPAYRLSVRSRASLALPSIDELQPALGLSRHEARVVAGLLGGRSLDDQAKERGVGPEAIRWHLRNIYNKLNCHSKAELVLIAMALVHM